MIQNKAEHKITTFLSKDILSTQLLSECYFLCHMFRITVLKQQTFLRKKNNKQDFFLNSFSSISVLYQKLFLFQVIRLNPEVANDYTPATHENAHTSLSTLFLWPPVMLHI